MDRDFKGVWIPKEIWLNNNLTLLEKIILIEIDSLDNDEHCIASNEYLADFCQCSERKVSESISKLANLGFIDVLSFDGRQRKLKSNMRSLALCSMQTSKICEAGSQNLQPNNIYNNIVNTNIENTNVFSTPKRSTEPLIPNAIPINEKPKKKNLYQKCMDAINDFTEDEEVRDRLKTYLGIRLERKDIPLGIKTFEGMLKKLRSLTESKMEVLQIIQQSIDRQYPTFYPLHSFNKQSYKNPEVIELSHTELTDSEFEEASINGQKF